MSHNGSKLDIGKLLDSFKNNELAEKSLEDIKNFFSELRLNDDLAEAFNNSIKSLFDMGFKAAENLNLNVFLDKFEEESQKED
ncbi:MAG: hypothetical protein GF317_15025 [Candidatus Lokiarchaeota archaeon]|nr:hypothetical protein [Candidatus Lokiarchaeota archaeon]MBD3200900.1 hypothetical protein [Candidatus Lokiarchaeota archaeon]